MPMFWLKISIFAAVPQMSKKRMATIIITTPQQVTIEYDLATLRERALAFVIDLLVVLTVYFLVILTFLNSLTQFLEGSEMLGNVFYFFLPLAGLLGYHFFSELMADGQSLGKRAMGLRVLRTDGRQPAASDCLLRSVFLLVDWLGSLGIVAAVLVSSSANNQRLGDLAANTTVIRTQSRVRFRLEDILRINSLDDYRPTYPQVQKLREEDMLVIKNALARYRRYRNEAHREVVELLCGRLAGLLEIGEVPDNRIEFLQTLLRDYIVLTR